MAETAKPLTAPPNMLLLQTPHTVTNHNAHAASSSAWDPSFPRHLWSGRNDTAVVILRLPRGPARGPAVTERGVILWPSS